MTVGEMPGVTPELARLYTEESRKELNMVFQFEHMGLDNGPYGKWDLKPLNLLDLKQNLTKWQKELENQGWNSLYFNNHDQPRSVSRFGNDREYRVESAKMLATLLHMMKGTPYVYQGEEIGMTNIQFDSINDYRDIEIHNFYQEQKEEGIAEEKIMESIYVKGRDNSRTPMQWDSSDHAGFTTGSPWMKVNPNFTEINAEKEIANPNSIYHYYRALIQLRKDHEVIVYGRYDLLDEDHPEIFSYKRTLKNQTLFVICNFYANEPVYTIPESIQYKSAQLLISNYERSEANLGEQIILKPFEARVYLLNNI
jgi:oligo-1,6-glucosidase